MKNVIYLILVSILAFTSCKEDENSPTQINTPPNAPILLSPGDNTTADRPVTLIWHVDANTFRYSGQISTDSLCIGIFLSFGGGFSDNDTVSYLPETVIHIISQQLQAFNDSTTYYWRVNATNKYGTSGWSTIWKFRVKD